MSEEHKIHKTFCPCCGEAITEPSECCLEDFVEEVREKFEGDCFFAVHDACLKCDAIVTFLYTTSNTECPVVIFDTDQERHRHMIIGIQGLLNKYTRGGEGVDLVDVYQYNTMNAVKQGKLVEPRHIKILEEWNKKVREGYDEEDWVGADLERDLLKDGHTWLDKETGELHFTSGEEVQIKLDKAEGEWKRLPPSDESEKNE